MSADLVSEERVHDADLRELVRAYSSGGITHGFVREVHRCLIELQQRRQADSAPKERTHRASQEVNAVGRWVGAEMYWDIEGESIADDDLRRWCWLTLPEPWNSCAGGIVNYHCAAYKHRRAAIAEYLQ